MYVCVSVSERERAYPAVLSNSMKNEGIVT